jgi:hypothetical protein
MHAVVDMMCGGGLDHLTRMWTFGAGLLRQECGEAFGWIILLRENATLKWISGELTPSRSPLQVWTLEESSILHNAFSCSGGTSRT